MHILITTTPGAVRPGRAEVHARSLLNALRAAGHQAEIVAVPFKWYPPEQILDNMLACRLMDLTEANGRKIDRIIGLKFPAYLIPHPNKVLWILHQHRQAYEQWDHLLGDMNYYGNGREVRDAIRRADTQLIPEARAVYTNSQETCPGGSRIFAARFHASLSPAGQCGLVLLRAGGAVFFLPQPDQCVEAPATCGPGRWPTRARVRGS